MRRGRHPPSQPLAHPALGSRQDVDLGRPHAAGALRRQHPAAVGGAPLGQVHRREGGEPARRHGQLVARRGVGGRQHRPGAQTSQRPARTGGDVPDGRAVRHRLAGVHHDTVHAERVGEVAAQRAVVRHAARHLDDAPEHPEAGTAIGVEAARSGVLPRPRDEVAHKPLQRVVATGGRRPEVPLEPTRVGQQVPHRDLRARLAVRRAELREVAAHGCVEVDLPLVDELHHQRRGPHLGDGLDHERRIGPDLETGTQVNDAGHRVGDRTVGEHRHRRPRHAVVVHQGGNALLEVEQARSHGDLPSQGAGRGRSRAPTDTVATRHPRAAPPCGPGGRLR